MSYKPFYISSFENDSGLDQYYESFLIPEKAFPILTDAYAWRGRIKRREGFQLLGRLRREIEQLAEATANGSPSYSVLDILSTLRATEPNAEIQPSTLVVTIDRGGMNESVYKDTTGFGILTRTSGPYTLNIGLMNYVTGALFLSFLIQPPNLTTVDVTLFYYPALPVMGLPTRETSNINNEEMVAFDQKYAYHYVVNQFEEFPSVTPTTWTGNDSQFFWATNYWQTTDGLQLFWVTNFNNSDPIRYWDQSTWNDFAPILRADSAATPSTLIQCRILLPYKDRLLAFNTVEKNTAGVNISFPQRVRWSQNGNPTVIGSVNPGPVWNVIGAWADDVVGKGGFVDAYTNEQIISAEFIKDVLIVKFERSSWKLLYTGNEVLPFIWQKINTELGAESTFSLVPFDRGVFSVGNVGIMTDDSVNVERIDQKIPRQVFDISNKNNGQKRVWGIRDFNNQLVYWTFPSYSSNKDQKFPNRMFVFNYVNQTWAIFNDSFTALGYFQRPSDLIWSGISSSWNQWNSSWNSGDFQEQFPDIAAGNQQGFVELLAKQTSNQPSLAITAITATLAKQDGEITVINHNLQVNQFIKITGVMGVGSTVLNGVIYKITHVIDKDSFNFITQIPANMPAVSGTYLGGGVITVLNNFSITTKRFSPFYEEGSQVRLAYVDFFLDKTTDGEITANLFIDESDDLVINDPNSINNPSEGLVGDNVVLTRPESTDIPYQLIQQKIWHRLYVYSISQNFQFQLTLDDDQMFNEDINNSEVILHAMTMYFSPNARMIQ